MDIFLIKTTITTTTTTILMGFDTIEINLVIFALSIYFSLFLYFPFSSTVSISLTILPLSMPSSLKVSHSSNTLIALSVQLCKFHKYLKWWFYRKIHGNKILEIFKNLWESQFFVTLGKLCTGVYHSCHVLNTGWPASGWLVASYS